MKTFGGHLKTVIFSLSVYFLVAELVLQLTHFGIVLYRESRWRSQLLESKKSDLVVLCIGESTTEWGGGTSYPSRLQERLRELLPGKRVSVVNGGKAASNSRELRSSLPALLKSTRPDFVVFMMGINDPLYLAAPETSGWWEQAEPWLSWSRVWRLSSLVRANYYTWAGEGVPGKINPLHQVPYSAPKHPASKEAQDYLAAGGEALKRGAWNLAKSNFQKYLSLSGQAFDYFQVGNAYFWQDGKGKFRQEAYKYLQKSYSLDPHFPETLWLLGNYLSDAPGQEERGKKILHEAIAEGGVNADLFIALAGIYGRQKKYEMERKILIEGIEKGRGQTRFFIFNQLLGECEKKDSQISATTCEKWWESAMEEFPGNTQLLALSPEGERAKEIWRLLRDVRNYPLHPGTKIYYREMVEEAHGTGARVVSMQYPTLDLEPLKNMLKGLNGVIFVENKVEFSRYLEMHPYSSLFSDSFAGSFGQTTPLGSDMIAKNLAKVISSLD